MSLPCHLSMVHLSHDIKDHLLAREACDRCPLVNTCAPEPYVDRLADGTYGGRLYVNGKLRKSPPRPGQKTAPDEPAPVKVGKPCEICGKLFKPRTQAKTCSPECKLQRDRARARAKQAARRKPCVDCGKLRHGRALRCDKCARIYQAKLRAEKPKPVPFYLVRQQFTELVRDGRTHAEAAAELGVDGATLRALEFAVA